MKNRPSPIAYPTTDEHARLWGFDIVEPVGTPMAWIHDWTSAYAGWNQPMKGMMDLGELLGSMGSDLSRLNVDDVMAAFCLMYRKDIFGLIEEIESEVDREMATYCRTLCGGMTDGYMQCEPTLLTARLVDIGEAGKTTREVLGERGVTGL